MEEGAEIQTIIPDEIDSLIESSESQKKAESLREEANLIGLKVEAKYDEDLEGDTRLTEQEILLGKKHNQNVRRFAQHFGAEIGMSEEDLAVLDIAAAAHDSEKYTAYTNRAHFAKRLAMHAHDSTDWLSDHFETQENGNLEEKNKAQALMAIMCHQGHPFIEQAFLRDMEYPDLAAQTTLWGAGVVDIMREAPEAAHRREFLPPLDKTSAVLFAADLLEKAVLISDNPDEEGYPAAGAGDKLVDINLGWQFSLRGSIVSARSSVGESLKTLKEAPAKSERIIDFFGDSFENGYSQNADQMNEIYNKEFPIAIFTDTAERRTVERYQAAGLLSADSIREAGEVQAALVDTFGGPILERYDNLLQVYDIFTTAFDLEDESSFYDPEILQNFPDLDLNDISHEAMGRYLSGAQAYVEIIYENFPALIGVNIDEEKQVELLGLIDKDIALEATRGSEKYKQRQDYNLMCYYSLAKKTMDLEKLANQE